MPIVKIFVKVSELYPFVYLSKNLPKFNVEKCYNHNIKFLERAMFNDFSKNYAY